MTTIEKWVDGVLVDTDPAYVAQVSMYAQRGEIEEVEPGLSIGYLDDDPYYNGIAYRDGVAVAVIGRVVWRYSFTERLRHSVELLEFLRSLRP